MVKGGKGVVVRIHWGGSSLFRDCSKRSRLRPLEAPSDGSILVEMLSVCLVEQTHYHVQWPFSGKKAMDSILLTADKSSCKVLIWCAGA